MLSSVQQQGEAVLWCRGRHRSARRAQLVQKSAVPWNVAPAFYIKIFRRSVVLQIVQKKYTIERKIPQEFILILSCEFSAGKNLQIIYLQVLRDMI
jgi:hypothetical protein